jgi:tRNA dimethylallyltransferase
MACRIPVVAVVGPTAAGKTALALTLASEFHGEIVGADSRQIYRTLDIGTGKPTPAEQAAARHHLLDVVEPDTEFSVALYLPEASEAIRAVHERGHLPLLVGGSGHYVWALLNGFRLPQVPPDHELRRSLVEHAEREGIDALFAQLERIDPAAASRIDRRNVRRVVRAIEVTRASGIPFSEAGTVEPPPYRTLVLGVAGPTAWLYGRIDDRVDRMIAAGWVEEVRGLIDRGYSANLPALSSLGYGAIVAHLRGEADLPATVSRIKTETHRFARSQRRWFRPGDPRIAWIDAGAGLETAAVGRVRAFLAGN